MGEAPIAPIAPTGGILRLRSPACFIIVQPLDLKGRKDRQETLAKTNLVGREVSVATVNSLDVVSRALGESP